MKKFVRLLIVGLLLVGLSGVVSAEEIRADKPIPVSFQVPEGYQVRVVDDLKAKDPTKNLIKYYEIDSASFGIDLRIYALGAIDLDKYPGAYAYDDLGAEEEKNETYDSRIWNSKYITLKNGHRAHIMMYYDENLPTKKEIHTIKVKVIHCGYEIRLWITHRDNKSFKYKPMTYEDKRLAYQILMSLDF